MKWRVVTFVVVAAVVSPVLWSWRPWPGAIAGVSVFTGTRFGSVLLFALPALMAWTCLGAESARARKWGLLASVIVALACALAVWYAHQRVEIYYAAFLWIPVDTRRFSASSPVRRRWASSGRDRDSGHAPRSGALTPCASCSSAACPHV